MGRFLNIMTLCIVVICLLSVLFMAIVLGELFERTMDVRPAIDNFNQTVLELEELLDNNQDAVSIYLGRWGLSYVERDWLISEIELYHIEISRLSQFLQNIYWQIFLIFSIPIGIIILIVAIRLLVKAVKNKCPSCKMFYGLRKVKGSKHYVGLDSYITHGQVGYTTRERDGKIESKQYGDVEYVRKKYVYTLKCKRCGIEQSRTKLGKGRRRVHMPTS